MFGRILIYCQQRRVLPLAIIGLLVGFAATGTSLIMLAPTIPDIDVWPITLLASVTSALFFMYARLQDEVKDLPVDLKYFPNTPLASGKVNASDVTFLKWLCIVSIVIINWVWGNAFVFCLFVLAVFILTEHEFFIPDVIDKNRLFAFLSHTPSWWFLILYLNSLFTQQDPATIFSTPNLLLATWMTFPLLLLEVARKTWPPEKEMEGYQTYSSLLGYPQAAIFAIILVLIHAVITVMGMQMWHFGWVFLTSLGISACLIIIKSVQFMAKPSDNDFSSLCELYILVCFVGLALNSWLGNAYISG